MHEVERGLNLVAALGMYTSERDLVLSVPTTAMQEITELLFYQDIVEHHPLVVVHPGCSMPARTYPWELYVQVIDELIEQLGAYVIVTGAEDERELVGRILESVQGEHRSMTLRLAGRLPFAEFCALIKTADLTITNNTGPMHISAAVKTPVVALFALTNPPEQWGPWHVAHRQLYHEVSCRLCYSRICPYQHECLSLVTSQMVVDAAQELLAAQPSGRERSLPVEARS